MQLKYKKIRETQINGVPSGHATVLWLGFFSI